MDYLPIYNSIAESGQVTNMLKKFKLYYDETNNPRTFRLTDKSFNVNEREFFVLGGIGLAPDTIITDSDLDNLFSSLSPQKNVKELKFKHISKKSNNFLSLITQPKVDILVNWIHDEKHFIHYSYVDNYYFTIVDIVDSMNESFYGGYYFNRALKNELYLLIKEHNEYFIKLLIEVDYPNIKDHNKFINKIIDWLQNANIEDNFYLEYLRQSLKNYKNHSLVFLENNQDQIAIQDYSSFFANLIVTYPNAEHIFDHELFIERILKNNPIEITGFNHIFYRFVDSKSERLIQISDLIVGILRYWLTFLESKNMHDLEHIFNQTTEEQKIRLRKFQKILQYSLEVSTGFKHSIVSDNFELKVNLFLEHRF